MENKALGKGLSALIPQKQESQKTEGLTKVKTTLLRENASQPRSHFDDEKLKELIASVREKGFLQPILVRQSAEGYEVIAGERRLRAARALGMEEVPVLIKNVSDEEALVLALVENIQRQELNAIEEAQAFERLIQDFKFTQDAVAQSVGKDRSTISNLLRLLKLPIEIQKSVIVGTISMGHARALVAVENPQEQKRFFEQIIKKNLSVRALENLLKTGIKGSVYRGKTKAVSKDNYLSFVEEDLQRILGSKVRIAAQKKRGKIVIEYYSNEDLERIVDIIKK